MLYIHLHAPEKMIVHIDNWFLLSKRPEWFDDELVREIIHGIDDADVIEGEMIMSPILGTISPQDLSRGCKAVIAMYKQDDFPVWGTLCGDNCAEYIIRISEMKDLHIVLSHNMNFKRDFNGVFVESGIKFTTLDGYFDEFIRLVEAGVDMGNPAPPYKPRKNMFEGLLLKC